MKIGIIGCGKVADTHANIATSIQGCKIVGVCDREELMAKQMQERYKVQHYSVDAATMLEKSRPDVVHITTPPQSHYLLGKLCLESGCHVYIEKPFTLNTKEAKELVSIANKKKLKLTCGTNIQFSDVTLRMRKLVKKGFLGGPPVHMESIFCYSLQDDFAKAFLGEKDHWVRNLPGKLLHNIISHGIARIAEFLSGDEPQVIVKALKSNEIIRRGGSDIHDELRTIIIDENGRTAYFTFSSQIKPVIHQFRLYGPENSILVDDDHQAIIKVEKKNYKSYLNYFVPPAIYAKQFLSNTIQNMEGFIRHRLYMDSGKRMLINEFYRSIIKELPPPISYREIILTSKIMDSIFSQYNKTSSL